MTVQPYQPRRLSRSHTLQLRGMNHHIREWGPPDGRPVVMVHGGLDSSITFQFVVDLLPDDWHIIAPDLRGHGDTDPAAQAYWFQDYLADLEGVLDALLPDDAVEIVGHSLGGNISCVYAGLRPARIAKLISLDGFGVRNRSPDEAPDHWRGWLDSWKKMGHEKYYASLDDITARLVHSNPKLGEDKAAFLAPHVSKYVPGKGHTWRFDHGHRRWFASLHYIDEWAACWRQITAPILWVQSGDVFPPIIKEGERNFEWRAAQIKHMQRAQVEGTGHNLHHEQPEAVARIITQFLQADNQP